MVTEILSFDPKTFDRSHQMPLSMKLNFLPFLLVGLLSANTVGAQSADYEQRDALKAARFMKDHPEHATAFTTKGAAEGMMICINNEALAAFDYAQRNEAPAPSVVALGTMNGVVQASETPQQLRTETPMAKQTSTEVAKRIEELEALRRQDPANADKYTRELKQLRDPQASQR